MKLLIGGLTGSGIAIVTACAFGQTGGSAIGMIIGLTIGGAVVATIINKRKHGSK